MSWRALALRATAAALALAGSAACLDLAHTNPFDPATKVDIQVTGPDSAFSLQQIIGFSVASKPDWSGVVEWKTTNESVLQSLGDGRYGVVGVVAPPNDTASVLVLLGTHTATHRVVVRQRVAGFRFPCLAGGSCGVPVGARTGLTFEGHDANGFRMVLPYSVQAESRQPSVLRIDGYLPSPVGSYTVGISALAAGATYLVVSSGVARDSVLVTVR
jgi:hypothetical protein